MARPWALHLLVPAEIEASLKSPRSALLVTPERTPCRQALGAAEPPAHVLQGRVDGPLVGRLVLHRPVRPPRPAVLLAQEVPPAALQLGVEVPGRLGTTPSPSTPARARDVDAHPAPHAERRPRRQPHAPPVLRGAEFFHRGGHEAGLGPGEGVEEGQVGVVAVQAAREVGPAEGG